MDAGKNYNLNELKSLYENLGNFITNQAISEEDNDMATEHRRVIIGWNDDGSPIRKHIMGNSQDEVNDRIVQEYIRTGRIYEFMDSSEKTIVKSQKERYLLKTYTEKWLSRKRKLKQTTYTTYEKYILKINKILGNKELQDISVEDVQRLLDSYSKLSHKTLKETKSILHQILKYAVSDGLIDKNVCESVDIEIPSDKVTIRQALPIDQFRDILSGLTKLQPMDRRYLALIMYTAMRRGEALGLRWEDIDFDKKTIFIQRNVTHPQQNQPVITTPKTKAGTRTIPLDDNLEELLEPRQSEGYIIGREKPLTLSAFRAMNERINSMIDLHGATAHTLRHSYLTYAVGETTDFKTIQGISGHADLGTLINRYAHPQEDKIRGLAEKMHQRLSV